LFLAGGVVGVTLIIAGVLQTTLEKRIPEQEPARQAQSAPKPPPSAAMPPSAATENPSTIQRRIAAPPNPTEQQQPLRRISSVELKANAAGHFVAQVDVNGRQFSMLVDTGATMLTLSHDDARKAAIPVTSTDFKHSVNTAAGPLKVARVKVGRVGVGPLMGRDLEALVLPAGTGNTSLLGMNYLRSLSSYEVKADKMIMRN